MSDGVREGERYRRIRQIGEGGAGRVWLVTDRLRPGSRLALKELTEASRGRLEGLRLEFATLTQLSHPNLVAVHDLEVDPERGLPFFTMEHVEGRDVLSAVRAEGPELALRLTAEALRALAFIHDFNLVHRDLKPANLMVRELPRLDCRLVLLDFGLAMRGGPADSPREAPAGTLLYMAPETFRGEPPGPRSDLYALGAVLFEAIHGRPPFELREDDLPAFLERVQLGRRPRPALPEGYPAGLQEWIEEILSPDPAGRPARAAEALVRLNETCGTGFPQETTAGRSARLASGPPPGREKEIAALWSHLAPSDEPRLVWLCGGPGSGKRRMTRWLAGEAVARGMEVLHPKSRPESDEFGAEGSDDLLVRVRARARERPTLVVVEHAESAGSRCVEFLTRVAREGREAPLRVLASLRPGEILHPGLQRLLASTGTVPTLRRVDLGPLDLDGVTAAIERCSGARGVAEARSRWVHEVTGGDPVLVETLLVDGAWEKRGRRREPLALGRAVASRVEWLTPPATAWLRALAVLGIESSEEEVALVAGLSGSEAGAAGEETVAAGLARRQENRWQVASRVLAEQLIAEMNEPDRIALHRRAAELLAARAEEGEVDPFLLARLWSGARERERAVFHATRAADRASDRGDPVEASERLAFALRNLPRRDSRRGELRLRQALALRSAGLPAQAARAYAAALRHQKGTGARADVLSRQAEMLVLIGRFELARRLALRALAQAQEAGVPETAARAHKATGIALARIGRAEEALPQLLAAVSGYEAAGNRLAQAHALQALGVTEVNAGLTEGREHFVKAIALSDALGESHRTLLSRIGLAAMERQAGRHEESDRIFREVRRLAHEHRHFQIEGIALCSQAANAIQQDRYAEAVALAQEAEDHAVHLGDYRLVCGCRAALGRALVQCGRAGEVAAQLETTLDGPMEQVDLVIADETRLALAEARLAARGADPASIKPALAAVIETARSVRDPDILLQALVLEIERRAATGGNEPIAPVLEEFETLVGQGGFWEQPFMLARVGVVRSASLLGQGLEREAIERAEEADRLAGEFGYLSLGARALMVVAEAHGRLGRQADATRALERARRRLDEAAERVGDEELKRGLVERDLYRPLRRKLSLAAPGIDRRLLALYDTIRALNSENDPDELLESILDLAIDVVQAERGMILLRDPSGDGFSVRLARNLEKETVEDAESYSRHIVAAAGAGKPILTIDAGDDQRFQDLRSVSLYGIRSLMCVPLRSRERIVGTVYLDTRLEGRMFDAGDLRFLEAFADHAALALENARIRSRLIEENRRLQVAAEERVRFDSIVGRCAAMQKVFDLIEKVAASELTALIQGETGTGKELVARAIHVNGPRRKAAFVSENCAALPETLLQSELFGHVRGAFTGAERERRGLIEQSDGGTLFLDEIGDMSSSMQAQLLRVLQEGEVRRVGGDRPVPVDVRFLAATHRDLAAEAAAGRFREDLMYRLQVLVVPLPPLRERPGDVPLLCDHFLERIARERGRAPRGIDPRLLTLFEEYSWPGNVRQIENTLRRLAVLAGEGRLTPAVLALDPVLDRTIRREERSAPEPVLSLQAHAREQIVEALRAASGNRTRAARMLGISRATIHRKIKEFGL